ncbi:hypothetical protein Ocin01_17206 [Orchesella cincta]|uniref:Uncharacterized protein n=1 Tax=Orchesella cincta TaxID=48709 RepID=A0A1D2M909_ORCCI|nr:hypothetical protein Ocin01_17206 [Orchesella cincta]
MKAEQEPLVLHVGGKELPTTLTELLSTPQSLCGIGALLFIVVGGAIRLTRMSATSSIQSYHQYSDPNADEQGDRITKTITPKGIWAAWKKFWGKLPRRVWNFYIDAFLVPAYRQEWDKYKQWSYRSQTRQPKTPAVRRRIRIQKRLCVKPTSSTPPPLSHPS